MVLPTSPVRILVAPNCPLLDIRLLYHLLNRNGSLPRDASWSRPSPYPNEIPPPGEMSVPLLVIRFPSMTQLSEQISAPIPAPLLKMMLLRMIE